jgi:hypothetical protein
MEGDYVGLVGSLVVKKLAFDETCFNASSIAKELWA